MISLPSFTSLEIPKSSGEKKVGEREDYRGGLFPYTEDPFRLYGLHNDAPVNISIEKSIWDDYLPTKPTLLQNEIATARSDAQPPTISYPSVTHYIYTEMSAQLCRFTPQMGGKAVRDPLLDASQRPQPINIYSKDFDKNNEAIAFRNRIIGFLAGVKDPKGKGRKFPDGTRNVIRMSLNNIYYRKGIQDKKFRELLLGTGNSKLVFLIEKDYFLPKDATCLGVYEKGDENRELDRGNYVGQALMIARSRLLEEEPKVENTRDAHEFYPYYMTYISVKKAVENGFFPKYIGTNQIPQPTDIEVSRIWKDYKSYPEELKRYYLYNDLSWIAYLYQEYINRRNVLGKVLESNNQTVEDVSKALGIVALKTEYKKSDSKESFPEWIRDKDPIVTGIQLLKNKRDDAFDKYYNRALQDEYKKEKQEVPFDIWVLRQPPAREFLISKKKYEEYPITVTLTDNISNEPLISRSNFDITTNIRYYKPGEPNSIEEYFTTWNQAEGDLAGDVEDILEDIFIFPEEGDEKEETEREEDEVEIEFDEDDEETPPQTVTTTKTESQTVTATETPNEEEKVYELTPSKEEVSVGVSAGVSTPEEEEYEMVSSSGMREISRPYQTLPTTEELKMFLKDELAANLEFRKRRDQPLFVMPSDDEILKILETRQNKIIVYKMMKRVEKTRAMDLQALEEIKKSLSAEESSFSISLLEKKIEASNTMSTETIDVLLGKKPYKYVQTIYPSTEELVKRYNSYIMKKNKIEYEDSYEYYLEQMGVSHSLDNFRAYLKERAEKLFGGAESADTRPLALRTSLHPREMPKGMAPFSSQEEEKVLRYREMTDVERGIFLEGANVDKKIFTDPAIYINQDRPELKVNLQEGYVAREAQENYQTDQLFRDAFSRYKFITGRGDPVSIPARQDSVYINLINGDIWSMKENTWLLGTGKILARSEIAYVLDEKESMKALVNICKEKYNRGSRDDLYWMKPVKIEDETKDIEFIIRYIVTKDNKGNYIVGMPKRHKSPAYLYLRGEAPLPNAKPTPIFGDWEIMYISDLWSDTKLTAPILTINDARIKTFKPTREVSSLRVIEEGYRKTGYVFPPEREGKYEGAFKSFKTRSDGQNTIYFSSPDDPIYGMLCMDYPWGFKTSLNIGVMYFPTIAHGVYFDLAIPEIYRTRDNIAFLYEDEDPKNIDYSETRKWKPLKDLLDILVQKRREFSERLFRELCYKGIRQKVRNGYYARLLASTRGFKTPEIVKERIEELDTSIDALKGDSVNEVEVHLEDTFYEESSLNENRQEVLQIDKLIQETGDEYSKLLREVGLPGFNMAEDYKFIPRETKLSEEASKELEMTSQISKIFTIYKKEIRDLVEEKRENAKVIIDNMREERKELLPEDLGKDITGLTREEIEALKKQKEKNIASNEEKLKGSSFNMETLATIIKESNKTISEKIEEMFITLGGVGSDSEKFDKMYTCHVKLSQLHSRKTFLLGLILRDEFKLQMYKTELDSLTSLRDLHEGSIVYMSQETPERNTIISETFTKIRDELGEWTPFYMYTDEPDPITGSQVRRYVKSAIEIRGPRLNVQTGKRELYDVDVLKPYLRFKVAKKGSKELSGALWTKLKQLVDDLVNAIFSFGQYTLEGRYNLLPQKAMVISSDKIAYVAYVMYRIPHNVNKPVIPTVLKDYIYSSYKTRREEVQKYMIEENKKRQDFTRAITRQDEVKKQAEIARAEGSQTTAGFDVRQGQLREILRGRVPDLYTVYVDSSSIVEVCWDYIIAYLENLTEKGINIEDEKEVGSAIIEGQKSLNLSMLDLTAIEAARAAVLNLLDLIYSYYSEGDTLHLYEESDINTVANIILPKETKDEWFKNRYTAPDGIDKIYHRVSSIYGQPQRDEDLAKINGLIVYLASYNADALVKFKIRNRITFFSLPLR